MKLRYFHNQFLSVSFILWTATSWEGERAIFSLSAGKTLIFSPFTLVQKCTVFILYYHNNHENSEYIPYVSFVV